MTKKGKLKPIIPVLGAIVTAIGVISALLASVPNLFNSMNEFIGLFTPDPPKPPIAIASGSTSVEEESLAYLQGKQSKVYPPSTKVVSFIWDQADGMPLSSGDFPNATAAPLKTFVAPAVKQDENLTFQLEVTDDKKLKSNPALKDIIVTDRPRAPEARITYNGDLIDKLVEVNETQQFLLNGSRSFDRDSDAPLTYSWEHVRNENDPPLDILGEDTDHPDIIAPPVQSDEVVKIRLTVSDDDGQQGIKTIALMIKNNQAEQTPAVLHQDNGFLGSQKLIYYDKVSSLVDGGLSASNNNTVDQFGIRKIYPTKPGGEEWYLNTSDPVDKRVTYRGPDMLPNEDSSWKVRTAEGEDFRFNVYTSTASPDMKIDQNLITNHEALAKQGFMLSSNDWRNVEITGYIKVNEVEDTGFPSNEIIWYVRGGKHIGGGPPEGCEGTAYRMSLNVPEGETRFVKEQWHPYYQATPLTSIEPSVNEWIGLKFVAYNTNDDTAVKLETYVDQFDDGSWEKLNEYIDKGGLGDGGEECGGKSDQVMTWGGPITTFRWESGLSDVDFKNFSIREIEVR